MNPREFEQWGQILKLPAAGIESIAEIRSAPPSRRVQGRASNVSGTYPSQKMGLTIQFESHKVELWAIYLRVKTSPGITITNLLASASGVGANDVYAMLVLDHLYVPLSEVPLVQHERVRLYLDRQTYDTYSQSGQHQTATSLAATVPPTLVANTRLRWDGRLWTLINLGETTTTLLPEIGQPKPQPPPVNYSTPLLPNSLKPQLKHLPLQSIGRTNELANNKT